MIIFLIQVAAIYTVCRNTYKKESIITCLYRIYYFYFIYKIISNQKSVFKWEYYSWSPIFTHICIDHVCWKLDHLISYKALFFRQRLDAQGNLRGPLELFPFLQLFLNLLCNPTSGVVFIVMWFSFLPPPFLCTWGYQSVVLPVFSGDHISCTCELSVQRGPLHLGNSSVPWILSSVETRLMLAEFPLLSLKLIGFLFCWHLLSDI